MNNKVKLKGQPWSIPLRDYVKTFPIVASIYDGEKLIHEEDLDYGKYEDRKFLGRHTHWALTQGYIVETSKAD